MDPVTLAAMGGSALSGLLGSISARRAAQQQAEAQRQAAQLQLQGVREGNALVGDLYQSGLNVQAPQLRAGQQALSALMSGIGLGPLQMQMRNRSGDVGGGGGGGSLGGGYLDASGRPYTGPVTTNAAGQPVDAAGQPLIARQAFDAGAIDQAMADAAANPYAGAFLERFTGQDIYRDPSYQFRLSEGERLLRARQAAGGNRWGSQAMKDITNYAQDAASQEFGNAYARFQEQKQKLYDRLSGLAGLASSTATNAAAQGSAAGGTLSGNIQTGYRGASGNLAGVGDALAGGTMGSTNALVGGINQAANTWLARDYFNRINQQLPRHPTDITTAGGP